MKSNNEKVLVALSGGIDSIALCLELMHSGKNVRAIFLDLG
jgi:tRNA U34 2-thiouridine synthase MnmA/TrmU